MPAYHSAFNELDDVRLVGNTSILPLKTRFRGPAPLADSSSPDIIDEAISLFRANCLFRNFELNGPADRLLIYLTLFISEVLSKVASHRSALAPAEAKKVLGTLALDSFALPGDATFPLNSMYAPPANSVDADHLRSYLTQARQEVVLRLLDHLYPTDNEGHQATVPSKWWMCFTKRKGFWGA
ncbi:actin-related protein arpc3 [Phaffia rhodozyma]|uniref:Actin-related protein 2/3 complex subunit 3 n=1 Tax=Phaffia rhodozyma TaxID=264483 RepID=A0A0F7SF40_PHARH|nr:actin-related protein arpc3 [Phaffia rhodozyma]